MHYSYWYILSVVLLLLEALAVPGVGLFFGAFGALSVALLIQWGLFADDSLLIQVTGFFFLTGLWAALLWKRLQKFRLIRTTRRQTHHDVIGRHAIVAAGGLTKGKRGNAHWSGALLSARLAEDAAINAAAEGDELKIVDMDGSTLILAEASYPTDKNDATRV